MSEPVDHSETGPRPRFAEVRSLKRELLTELRASWEQGEPVRPEALLARWPADPASDADVASVLFEDYLARSDRGETPSIAEYEERFPKFSNSLAGLLNHQDLLRSLGGSGRSVPRLRLPALGDDIFGFRLRRELGRGAFARVFLAEQGELAGRPVVLKVSAIEGNEPQTLAQLQHTHIVPIYSVHEDARAGLRAVCMPYFGGASLNQVLLQLWQQNPHPAAGQELVQALALVRCQSVDPVSRVSSPGTAENGPLTTLRQFDYFRATAWIIARLAEGLQHAHERGVLHRDIKPSNILLGDDGQPMLLDFNLAQQAENAADATLGGTVAYMAPEHLRAMARQERSSSAQVDGRADVYSLGTVLFEMLTGQRPFGQENSCTPLPMLIEAMAVERAEKAPSARALRPDLPWGLESVVRKCLDPDPARRYQAPEYLAEDLRRFLDDRPLKVAPELSTTERMAKWARRHPRLCSTAAVASAAAVLLIAAGLALTAVRGALAEKANRLEATEARDRLAAHEAGTLRALLLVNTTSDQQHEHLRQGRQECERTLAIYGMSAGRPLDRHPDWARLDERERQRLAEQTQELLLLLAGAHVRLNAEPSKAATMAEQRKVALHRALGLLDLAETLPGLPPSRALCEDRAAYREALGDPSAARKAREKARTLKPASARDFYLLAMTHARAGRYAEALVQLDRAIEREPKHYWSWVQRGVCHQERKEYALAASDFGVCVGLWPDFAWGYFNQASALDHCGHRDEAIRAYGEALRRDPKFVLAWLNRGLARLELGQNRQALEDFDRAIEQGRDDAFVHSGRGVALERLGRHVEADRAFEQSARKAGDLPARERRRLRWVYAFAVAARLADRAQAAFEEVLREHPDHPQALYGCAMLLDREGRAEKALHFFDGAIRAAPHFVEPRRYRAVLLARLGRSAAAERDINWCLERESDTGATHYAAACVTALLAEREQEAGRDHLVKQALKFLDRAFARGYGRDRAATDDDLAILRDHPTFRTLLTKASR